MFSGQKRIFAGKHNLQREPFCPYLTDESGRQSLLRNSFSFDDQPGGQPHVRPTYRDGKRRS